MLHVYFGRQTLFALFVHVLSKVLHAYFGRHTLFALGPNKAIDATKHDMHKKASNIILTNIMIISIMLCNFAGNPRYTLCLSKNREDIEG